MTAFAEIVLDRLGSGVFCVTRELAITSWNRFMVTHTGVRAADAIGRPLFDCVPELPRSWLTWKVRTVFELGTHAFSSWRQRPYVFRFAHNRPLTGGVDCMRQDLAFVPVRDAAGAVEAVAIVIQDATDAALSEHALERANAALKHEMAERRRLEVELRLAQRLEAVGQLAAGIAHEMNTPLQFLGDGVSFLADAFRDLGDVLARYREAAPAEQHAALRAAEEAADLAYVEETVPRTLARTQAGIATIAKLVRSMMGFGDMTLQATHADLHAAIDATLAVAAASYKSVADIARDYGELPRVLCHVGELNQAFYALIVNAAHAIEQARPEGRGTITIRTRVDGDHAVIEIGDDGGGIPAHIRDRIYEPFFTTKEVGQGTGLGLTTVRSVIADQHGGTVAFETEDGRGTTFTLRLPIEGRRIDLPIRAAVC